jgi:hypothetical protein
MSNQQVPKNDRARITVFSRLRPHFTLIDSLILSNEAFPTGVLEGLADELDYGMPGYYSEEAQATYAALAEVQNNHVKEADKQLQQQQKGFNKNYTYQAQLDAQQQYEQQIMIQQQFYYQQQQYASQFSASQPQHYNQGYGYQGQPAGYTYHNAPVQGHPQQAQGYNQQNQDQNYPNQGQGHNNNAGHANRYRQVNEDEELKLQKTHSTPPALTNDRKTKT